MKSSNFSLVAGGALFGLVYALIVWGML